MTTVNQLLKRLLRIPKKDRDKEIFLQARYKADGTIVPVGQIKQDVYSFFGRANDCFIIKEDL